MFLSDIYKRLKQITLSEFQHGVTPMIYLVKFYCSRHFLALAMFEVTQYSVIKNGIANTTTRTCLNLNVL